METLSVVGGLLGILAVAAGVVMLTVSAFRKRPLKKWALTTGSGFLVFVVMVAISPTPLELEEDSDGGDASGYAPKPCWDCVEFGVGEAPASDVLDLVGVSKTFAQDSDLWLRVRLKKSAGSGNVEYFLQQQRGGPGWTMLDTWVSSVDPGSNIFREREPALQSLDPADYKVFVIIGDEKRAEGLFTIVAAPVLDEATSTFAPPGTTPKHEPNLMPDPTVTTLPVSDPLEVMWSRDSCALFMMAATTIEPRGVEAMKSVADKYAPGMTLELVLWFSERLETIPTSNVEIANFAKMLALVRQGAIPGIEMGDYYTLRSRYDGFGRWPHKNTNADTIVREIIGDESQLDELFGKIDTTNIQIQIDRQKEQGIVACASLDMLAPISVSVAVSLDGFVRGKCDRAISFYSDRMEILTETFQGIDGERSAAVTLSFKDPQQDTYGPRLTATLQKAGESIAERCARP